MQVVCVHFKSDDTVMHVIYWTTTNGFQCERLNENRKACIHINMYVRPAKNSQCETRSSGGSARIRIRACPPGMQCRFVHFIRYLCVPWKRSRAPCHCSYTEGCLGLVNDGHDKLCRELLLLDHRSKRANYFLLTHLGQEPVVMFFLSCIRRTNKRSKSPKA